MQRSKLAFFQKLSTFCEHINRFVRNRLDVLDQTRWLKTEKDNTAIEFCIFKLVPKGYSWSKTQKGKTTIKFCISKSV